MIQTPLLNTLKTWQEMSHKVYILTGEIAEWKVRIEVKGRRRRESTAYHNTSIYISPIRINKLVSEWAPF